MKPLEIKNKIKKTEGTYSVSFSSRSCVSSTTCFLNFFFLKKNTITWDSCLANKRREKKFPPFCQPRKAVTIFPLSIQATKLISGCSAKNFWIVHLAKLANNHAPRRPYPSDFHLGQSLDHSKFLRMNQVFSGIGYRD